MPQGISSAVAPTRLNRECWIHNCPGQAVIDSYFCARCLRAMGGRTWTTPWDLL